jgi:two-component system phosphate regulon sensor histidine kinase PhoR
MKNRKNTPSEAPATRLHGTGLFLLMAIPVLIISGFQLYWLIGNYEKEKKNLTLRTNILFREAVRNLQGKKLKLDSVFGDTSGFSQAGHMAPLAQSGVVMKGEEAAGLINNLTIQINNLLKKSDTGSKKNVFITVEKNETRLPEDPDEEFHFTRPAGPPPGIVRFLYKVDSLQDSLRISEVDSAYRAALNREKIAVSYSIVRKELQPREEKKFSEIISEPNKITIGFAHPVTFELTLNSTTAYLFKRMLSPGLFSFFLVGVTLFSFVLLYRNIQNQKRLAVIKNEFISNMTHELKTPLATVGAAIEALRNFSAIEDPQRTREYLEVSQNELQRLSLLVDKVLRLSMFENKEMELQMETLHLEEVIKEVVSSMKIQIEKQQAEVSVHVCGHPVIQGDKLHLLSVCYNLLDNALKYTNGRARITIELKENGKDVLLLLSDNGMGIAPEYQGRVFEKFFRVPTGDRHNTKGYGLGLYYVAQVVRRHFGKIKLESRVGAGTTFIITLPRQL